MEVANVAQVKVIIALERCLQISSVQYFQSYRCQEDQVRKTAVRKLSHVLKENTNCLLGCCLFEQERIPSQV